jgi:hypothetical protein
MELGQVYPSYSVTTGTEASLELLILGYEVEVLTPDGYITKTALAASSAGCRR